MGKLKYIKENPKQKIHFVNEQKWNYYLKIL